MVRVGNFGVDIEAVGAMPFVMNGDNYVSMTDGTEYRIRLTNYSDADADAEVNLEGRGIGKFRVNRRSSSVLERGAYDRGRFTFFGEFTDEALSAGVVPLSFTNGLVDVTFYPEKRVYRPVSPPRHPSEYSMYRPVSPGRRSIIEPVATVSTPFRPSSSLRASSPTLRFTQDRVNLIEDRRVMSAAPMSMMRGDISGPLSAGATVLGRDSSQRYDSVPDITRIDSREITRITIRLVVRNEGYARPERRTSVPPRINNSYRDFY